MKFDQIRMSELSKPDFIEKSGRWLCLVMRIHFDYKLLAIGGVVTEENDCLSLGNFFNDFDFLKILRMSFSV